MFGVGVGGSYSICEPNPTPLVAAVDPLFGTLLLRRLLAPDAGIGSSQVSNLRRRRKAALCFVAAPLGKVSPSDSGSKLYSKYDQESIRL